MTLPREQGGKEKRSRRIHPRWGSLLTFVLATMALLPAAALGGQVVSEEQNVQVAARIARLLPAVVGILTDVSAEVTVRCGKNETYTVKPAPDRGNATGFIIHPDGWIATNGHVVKSIHEDDEARIRDFLDTAAKAACGPGLAKLPAQRRKARLAAIVRDPANRKGVKLTKRLEVYLPTVLPPGVSHQTSLPAVVKAYSPPIDPHLLPKDGSPPKPPMLDAAIIKIEATDLPVVPLARNAEGVFEGQPLVIAGYPGAVLWHDALSRKSQAAATVTFGRMSGFKLDVNDRTVMQTDAAITWGNSGGPAFDLDGDVIGVATFISTSLEGDQAIQGFNFLIPVDTIQAMARQIGLTPKADSPFMTEWNRALNSAVAGHLREALEHVDAADKIVPGLIDVWRARERIRKRLEEESQSQEERVAIREREDDQCRGRRSRERGRPHDGGRDGDAGGDQLHATHGRGPICPPIVGEGLDQVGSPRW